MATGTVSTESTESTENARVLVAFKAGPGSGPALSAGRALAAQMGATVEVVYVGGGTDAIAASAAAAAAGAALNVIEGPVVGTLVREARRAGIVALVLAARSQPGTRRPHGRVPLAVAAVLTRPVLIVPPGCAVPVLFHRLLVPIDEGLAPSAGIRLVRRLARNQQIDIVLLHVHGTDSIPPFNDHPHHEALAWERRFRHQAGAMVTEMPLVQRIGDTTANVLSLAEEAAADLIVLEWAADLGPGRSTVVRQVVGLSHVPVLLVRANRL